MAMSSGAAGAAAVSVEADKATPSWLLLPAEHPSLAMADDAKARDPQAAVDCGWAAQMPPFIHRFSRPGDAVLDPFCGFGTTLAACAATGRRGVGLEIESTRVAQAQQRLASLAERRDDRPPQASPPEEERVAAMLRNWAPRQRVVNADASDARAVARSLATLDDGDGRLC